MIITVIFFILLLGALILAHEWGHFFAARKFGVKVQEFGFGFSGHEFGLKFPPRIFSFRKKGVLYSVNPIPLGGFVKIFGEQGEGEGDKKSFASRPIWQRSIIIIAGVTMNLILAWFLFSLGHGLGLPTVVSEGEAAKDARVTVIGVQPNSPAEKAGLRFGDAVLKFEIGNSKFEIATADEVQKLINEHRGENITIGVSRGQELIEVAVVPRRDPPAGEGPLGIAMAKIGRVSSPWYRAPWDGLKTTFSAVVAIVSALGRALGDLIFGGRVSADISGPVGIFVFADQTRQLGIVYLLELAGILSVNLALINILPIPALDGGRVLFLAIEKMRGVKVDQRVESFIHAIGLILLMLLMAAVTFRDIVRIF